MRRTDPAVFSRRSTVIATPPYNTDARRLFTSHFRARAMAAIDDLESVAALREAGIAGA